jgi:aminoglycoside N3'-acetyltransferase
MVHASLTSLGYVRGGPRTVITALMETVTRDGVLMMPSFNHGEPFQKGPGYYAPAETPTSDGIIADTFWRMPGVKRSLDPAHPVAAWGRNAAEYVKRHGQVPTMGIGSPIQLLEEAGGKVVLLGTGYGPNSLRHVVEMTNGAKCLGVRTEEYPVKLPNGRRIKGRTWSWRAGRCPLLDDVHWTEERMITRRLDQRVMIGNALAVVFDMRDFRMVAEELLREGLPGIPRCHDCRMGIACTGRKEAMVASDWTAEKMPVT